MRKKLNANPIKKQVVIDKITSHIKNGNLLPGERLMPLRDMASELGVSPSVAYRALKELESDNFLECRGTQGFYVKENGANAETEGNSSALLESASAPKVKGKMFLNCAYHSDLTWKYTYEEYESIREKQFDSMAEYFRKYENFHAHVEQALTLRMYLEKHPEKLELFRRMVKEGRLNLTGGNTIPDLNMCSGELLVRNIQAGRNYFRDTFGVNVSIANETDAFGMCVQLPQILAKSGYRHFIPGRIANWPDTIEWNTIFRWYGADGSSIIVTPPTTGINHAGYVTNLPVIWDETSKLYDTILKVRNSEYTGDIFAIYCCEEALFQESMFWQIDAANRTPGSRKVEFGSLQEYCERIDARNLTEIRGEFNPTFTGCYTTRIGVKQKLRNAENLMFSAEMLAAGLDMSVNVDEAWHNLQLVSFHDAVCGCHTDAANRQVNEIADKTSDMLRKAIASCAGEEAGFLVFNPDSTGGSVLAEYESADDTAPKGFDVQEDAGTKYFVAELPSCGIARFSGCRGGRGSARKSDAKFSTLFFDVDFSTSYPKIFSRKYNREVFGNDGFGEILFREDVGSMWDEAYLLEPYGRTFQKETVESVTEGDVFHKVVTTGKCMPHPAIDGAEGNYWAGFESLSFRKEYRFYKKLDYFTLKVTLDWKGNNTKINIRFPLNLDVVNASALYDVPFAAIERKPYFEVPKKYESTLKQLNRYNHARSGDWPARHWVDYCDNQIGVAMANSGTPAHQLVAGNIIVSLLRSGTMIADGRMRPDPGSYDNGEHCYEFAFRPHLPHEMGNAAALGRVMNRKPVVFPNKGTVKETALSFLKINRDNIVISSLRRSEDGALILRAYETLGSPVCAEIRSGLGHFDLQESDLQELEWHDVSADSISFGSFEIKTLKLVFRG